MIKDIIGTVMSIILVFLMLMVTPLYYIGIIQWASSESAARAYTRNLVDEVIDTRELKVETLQDYNLSMASLSDYYNTTVMRQVKVVNPDPLNPGQTYSSYQVVDDIYNYNQGDLIVVKVEPLGKNMFQIIARSMLGLSMSPNGFTFPGRVR